MSHFRMSLHEMRVSRLSPSRIASLLHGFSKALLQGIGLRNSARSSAYSGEGQADHRRPADAPGNSPPWRSSGQRGTFRAACSGQNDRVGQVVAVRSSLESSKPSWRSAKLFESHTNPVYPAGAHGLRPHVHVYNFHGTPRVDGHHAFNVGVAQWQELMMQRS